MIVLGEPFFRDPSGTLVTRNPLRRTGGAVLPWSGETAVASPNPELALGITQLELAEYRVRRNSGPYRVGGDVRTNSPGDWGRVVSRKQEFLADPYATGHTWAGATDLTTCVAQNQYVPNEVVGRRMHNAAFYAMVQADVEDVAPILTAVKDYILWHANQPGLQFGTTPWCTGILADTHPSFTWGIISCRFVYAYSYLKYLQSNLFSAPEKTLVEDWIRAWAYFWKSDLNAHSGLGKLFPNRQQQDYSTSYPANWGTQTHFEGYTTATHNRHYNNRRCVQVRSMALAGMLLQDEVLLNEAKLFFREFFMFSMFGSGIITEFERSADFNVSSASGPEWGWSYSAQTLDPLVTVADLFARRGDFSLYDYTTREGVFNSSCAPGDPDKGLLRAIKFLGNCVDHSVEIYSHAMDPATTPADKPYFRIDAANERPGYPTWYGLHEVSAAAVANTYYRDTYLTGMYTRTGAGMRPYMADQASYASYSVWEGDWGSNIAALFRCGGSETRAWSPYPGKAVA